MSGILLWLIVFVIGVIGIAGFVRWYTRFCYDHIIASPSAVLDGILLTSQVPDRWRHRGVEKLAALIGGRLGQRLGMLLVRRYARRMKSMLSFVQGNSRLSAEEKKNVCDSLTEIRSAWLQCSSLDELLSDE